MANPVVGDASAGLLAGVWVFDSSGGDPQGIPQSPKSRQRAQGSVCPHPAMGTPQTRPAGLCFVLVPDFPKEEAEELGFTHDPT